jgi:hypothetical protein
MNGNMSGFSEKKTNIIELYKYSVWPKVSHQNGRRQVYKAR